MHPATQRTPAGAAHPRSGPALPFPLWLLGLPQQDAGNHCHRQRGEEGGCEGKPCLRIPGKTGKMTTGRVSPSFDVLEADEAQLRGSVSMGFGLRPASEGGVGGSRPVPKTRGRFREDPCLQGTAVGVYCPLPFPIPETRATDLCPSAPVLSFSGAFGKEAAETPSDSQS